MALADRICANGPTAVRQSRRVLYAVTEAADEEGWELVAQAQEITLASADRSEGVRAFIEKRPPSW